MHASKVIDALTEVRPSTGAASANWPSEEALLAAIEAKLRTLLLKFVRRPITRSRSRPELLVDSEPNLLLAICLSGDWKAAVAATQLSAGLKGLPLARPVVVLAISTALRFGRASEGRSKELLRVEPNEGEKLN